MTNTADEIIKRTEEILVRTYVPQPVVMDRGEGCYAYDTDGRKYLDFAVGTAVASLGHASPAIIETIKTQAARLMAVQSSYATREKLDAAELVVKHTGLDLVYFGNSGTESVEAALKTVRKWAYENKGPDCNEIITFRQSFHGRTYGSASVTEKRLKQPYFAPYVPSIHFAKFNDIDSVRALISDKTAAIIVEPVQGEGGLIPAEDSFLKSLRELCDTHRIALILDEVQTGMGRTGTLFAFQQYGIKPDILCLAKGLGGGFPVGAMVAKREFGCAIEPGSHGTTYGGNPLACAVVSTVIREILKPGFMENVQAVSKIMFEGLERIRRGPSNAIKDVRGKGLMIGIDTEYDIKKLIRAVQKNGLMTTQAGDETLRLLPPLILNKEQAEEALDIIERTLKEMGD